jgi:hypothetical protein
VRGDIGHPFLTLSRAKTNAVSGDTIFVMPGLYEENDLLKTNTALNWHFFSGSIVTNNQLNTMGMFDDFSTGAVTSNITGDGTFLCVSNGWIVETLYPDTRLRIKFDRMYGGGDGSPASSLGMVNDYDGRQELEGNLIQSKDGSPIVVLPIGAGDTCSMTLNRLRIVHTGIGTYKPCIDAFSSPTNVFLRDCVLVIDPGGTNSIRGPSGTGIKIYGSLMSNATNNPDVTILTGASRFEVDPGVK